MFTRICSRISRSVINVQIDFVKTIQNRYFTNEYLETWKKDETLSFPAFKKKLLQYVKLETYLKEAIKLGNLGIHQRFKGQSQPCWTPPL